MKKIFLFFLLFIGVAYTQPQSTLVRRAELGDSTDVLRTLISSYDVDSMKIYNVLHYGVVADGSTDNYAKILNIIALMPSSATLYFPAQDSAYIMTNGVKITKPIKILGQGSKSRIKVTSGTTLSPLFYMGGSDPNGTPYPAYSAGTEYNFKNNLTKGQSILTGMESTTGLVAGDEIFLALGKDTIDTGQNAYRMWNKVKTVNSPSSITLEIPIPEDIDSTMFRSPTYSWAADSHAVYKYTTLPDGFEVGNLSIEYDASVSSDFVVGTIRAKNLYIHDIWVNRTQAGAPIVVGETENAKIENIYITKGAGIQIYGSRNVSVENVFCEQLTGTGLVLETQNRGVTVDGFTMQYGSSNTGTQVIFAGGNSKNVHLKNFNFISDSVSQAILHLTGTTENNQYDLITENFAFHGDTGAVKSFPIKQHIGILDYNGMIYSKTKHYRKTIDIVTGTNTTFDLVKGIIKDFKIKLTNRGYSNAGVNIVQVKNETTAYGETIKDSANSIDYLPADGVFGRLTADNITRIGSSYPYNNTADMKEVFIQTAGTVPANCQMIVEVEYYTPEDDGVNGKTDSEVDSITYKLNKSGGTMSGNLNMGGQDILNTDSLEVTGASIDTLFNSTINTSGSQALTILTANNNQGAQISLKSLGNENKRVYLGYDYDSNSGYLQVVEEGVANRRLYINSNSSVDIDSLIFTYAVGSTLSLTDDLVLGNGRIDLPAYENMSLDSLVTRVAKADTLNYGFSIPDVADGSYSGAVFTTMPITITMVRAVLRTASTSDDTAKCNIYFSTDISSGSPNTLWSVDKSVIDSTTGTTYSSFNDATIPAYSWIWLQCNDEVGTVNQLNMTVYARKD